MSAATGTTTHAAAGEAAGGDVARGARGPLGGSAEPLADRYDVALLDLDGVVYRGATAVPDAAEALHAARRRGLRLAFVTNNASRTPDAVAARLQALGVPAAADEVVTSAQAAAGLVAQRVPAGSPVLVVGGEGLWRAVAERGLRPVRSATERPAAVVQGYGPEVGWAELAEACYAVAAGVPWVASNLDVTVPTERGLAPGNGALVAAVRAATGREPEVAGKPELPLHAEAVRRTAARRPLVVGDRLDTDIEGAVRAATPSLLVLTGVATARDVLAAPPPRRPTYVGADLAALLAPHPQPHRDGPGWVVGGWTARVDGRRLRLEGGGDPLDGLRAACAAAWDADRDDLVLDDATGMLGAQGLPPR